MQKRPDHVLQRIARLPVASEPGHETRPPNPDIPLFRGWFSLKQGSKLARIQGKVAYRWFARPGVYFEGTASSESPVLKLEEAELVIENPPSRFEVNILHITCQPLAKTRKYTGRGKGITIIGRRRNAKAVRFHLLNFHNFMGSNVRRGTGQKEDLARARLTLKSYGWRISIDQLLDCQERLTKVSAEGGYVLTHAGSISRPRGQSIKFSKVQPILSSLALFFGFLRGFWCGPVIPIGAGKATQQLWTAWANWKLTPWLSTQSWFPRLKAEDTGTLYRGFEKLRRDPLWNRVLSSTIHWYIHANADARSTEARIVSVFIGLEMIAWALLVESHQRLSNNKFNGLSAEKKLDMLFNELGIPSEIPVQFMRLKSAASRRNLKSGPAILAAVRNALVHPKKSKRRFVARIVDIVLWELSQLALSYLELVHLALLGYDGPYVRRVFDGLEEDALATVPWN